MLDACLEALEFIQGKSRADLDKNRMPVLSLVKEVEIIGEAAAKISPKIKSIHPEIPWQDMALMRNRLIHAYFEVDLSVVWETIQKDIPDLREKLEAVLNQGAQEPRAVYPASPGLGSSSRLRPTRRPTSRAPKPKAKPSRTIRVKMKSGKK
jgi:uncharacterized protein with HEPN domain